MTPIGFIARLFLPRSVYPVLQERYHLLRRRAEFCREFGWRYWPLSRYLGVSGFLMPQEARTLHDLARSADKGAVIVEIGSWLGKSAVVFGTGLRKGRGGSLFCIDPFDASGDQRSSQTYATRQDDIDNSLYQTFLQNIKANGVADFVFPLQGRSEIVVKGWDRPIDLLFIDGDHSFEAVARDFAEWSKFVKEGGHVCFHDVLDGPAPSGNWHEGPHRVVETIVKPKPEWEEQGRVHSLYITKRVSHGRPN